MVVIVFLGCCVLVVAVLFFTQCLPKKTVAVETAPDPVKDPEPVAKEVPVDLENPKETEAFVLEVTHFLCFFMAFFMASRSLY